MSTSQYPLVGTLSFTYGCDPEFFFVRKKRLKSGSRSVAGSERIIPKEGIRQQGFGRIVRDGVQGEVHTIPATCRAHIGNYIQECMKALRGQLEGKSFVPSFDQQVVKVSRRELARLSEEARKLGCEPSKNAHGDVCEVNVDGLDYPIRSGGGHIHIGCNSVTDMYTGMRTKPKIDKELFVNLLDIFVGNTCVLIDRDPRAAERRKLYGRAGEYRTPPHGLEYRTLSNFWLRAYPLMSLVFALVKTTSRIVMSPHLPKHLCAAADMPMVVDAINTNNLALAQKTYDKVVRPFLSTRNDILIGINPRTVKPFDFFAKKVQEKGLEYWFPEDPLQHWCTKNEGHYCGWETFVTTTIQPKLARLEASMQSKNRQT